MLNTIQRVEQNNLIMIATLRHRGYKLTAKIDFLERSRNF